jgi:hypothetical protein
MSVIGNIGDRTWRPWRTVAEGGTNGETFITNYLPSEFAASKAICVHPYTTVALRFFGQDAGGAGTYQVKISGWMSLDGTGRGPGFLLWHGALTGNATNETNEDLLERQGDWTATPESWWEAASWTETLNACQAQTITGSNQSMLILPTVGFACLMAEIGVMSGAFDEATDKVGIMYCLGAASVLLT